MKKKVILNMIVKNESKVIQRCLNSVKNLIDGWVIVDTGSNDRTQQIVQTSLQSIPGELHERPWVDFQTNRNEALELARDQGDYLLFIDADDYLITDESFSWPDRLDQDGYLIHQKTKEPLSRAFQYLLLIKASLNWKWSGLFHEELVCSDAQSFAYLPSITYICTMDGSRSEDPDKLKKDAQILETAHQKEPQNSRYLQFLAMTYEAMGENTKALTTYRKRSAMPGGEEELFYALYRIADLERKLKMDPGIFLKSFGKAHQKRPARAEPLYWQTHYAISQENFSLGYLLSKEAITLPFPKQDALSVESWIYEYGSLLQFIKCSYQMGKYRECKKALDRLSQKETLPESIRSSIREIAPIVKSRAESSV